MPVFTRRIVAMVLAVSVLGSALGGYELAYAAHPAGVSHFEAITGALINDAGIFNVQRGGPIALLGPDADPSLGAALFVTQASLAPSGSSLGSPALFNCGQGFCFAENGLTPGDWVLGFSVTNKTNLPMSATYSMNFTLIQAGAPVFFSSTLYIGTSPSPTNPVQAMFVWIDIGPSFTTPMSYTITIQRIV